MKVKIFRFMSKKEFDKLIKGEVLKNNKHHQGRTNSVGFCFMKVDDNEPRYAYKFLSGVVYDDICVVFETNKKLTKSYGVYADPYGSLVDNVIKNGVGGVNIDECRVGNTNADTYDLEKRQVSKATGSDDDGHFLDQLHNQDAKHGVTKQGRFPANTILTYDETDFDEVCGGFPNTKGDNRTSKPTYDKSIWGNAKSVESKCLYADSGSASRYFYCAKASKKDRDEGLNVETEEYMLKEDIDENIKNNIKRLLNL